MSKRLADISSQTTFSFFYALISIDLVSLVLSLYPLIDCNYSRLLFRIDLIIVALGSIFAGEVQVYDCIFCENDSGYAYIIHDQCFYASRCQSLFRIDIIIMALGSIFAGEVQIYDCIFCENESGYASIIQKLMFLCFKTSVFIQI